MHREKIQQIISELHDELLHPKALGIDETCRCLNVCTRYYQELKETVTSYEFESQEEEIYFFKELKPQVAAQYYYYLKLYKIETDVPMGSTDMKGRFYEQEIKKIDHYMYAHKDFCAYMRKGATYMDQFYFTRGHKAPELFTNYQHMDLESTFATSHGFVVARILAADRLYAYLRNKISMLEQNYAIVDELLTPIEWKGSKVNLVVMMYGLVETGQVDCDIATLAAQLQKIFGIELKDTYRVWNDVKARKKEAFPWLKEMIRKLEEKIRED